MSKNKVFLSGDNVAAVRHPKHPTQKNAKPKNIPKNKDVPILLKKAPKIPAGGHHGRPTPAVCKYYVPPVQLAGDYENIEKQNICAKFITELKYKG